jgi:hypothetical protein
MSISKFTIPGVDPGAVEERTISSFAVVGATIPEKYNSLPKTQRMACETTLAGNVLCYWDAVAEMMKVMPDSSSPQLAVAVSVADSVFVTDTTATGLFVWLGTGITEIDVMTSEDITIGELVSCDAADQTGKIEAHTTGGICVGQAIESSSESKRTIRVATTIPQAI